MKRFEVVFTPDDDGWHAEILSVKGCHSWGRSLTAARRHIREALSTCVDVLGEDAERIARDAELVERFDLPAVVERILVRYRENRERAAALEAQLQALQVSAAKAIVKRFSVRDAGELLGVSGARVNQIVSRPERPARRLNARRSVAKPVSSRSS